MSERLSNTPTEKLVIHAPDGKHGKIIQHDCSSMPDDPQFDRFKLTKPCIFRDGDEVNFPLDVADYFKRAGWAAAQGEQPTKPDATKPVFVQPDSVKNGNVVR